MLPDGRSQQVVFTNPYFIDFEDWSPDGKWIILSEMLGFQKSQLVRINLSGSDIDVLTDSDGFSYFCGWTPDKERFIYSKFS